MIKLILSLWLGKLISIVCRLLPNIGGSALPGLIILKLNPLFIHQLIRLNNLQSLIITGTNGKTTTARILGSILTANRTAYLHNRSGSNLMRGIASTIIKSADLSARLPAQLAVWEIDEAVVPQAVKTLKPSHLLFTNLFRDQLDRYGEIDTVLKKWQQSLLNLPSKTKLIVNRDDPSLNFLALNYNQPKQTIGFGLPQSLTKLSQTLHSADSTFCPKCLKPLTFTAVFTSHLGHYHCPYCGFKRPKPDFKYTNFAQSSLPGLHNQYNLLAASVLAKLLNIPDSIIKTGIKNFKPAFGRAESFTAHNQKVSIMLVKNPTGFNAVLETLSGQNQLKRTPLLIILNDLTADGRDVSWIWDVNFNYLKSRQTPIIVSGLRAYDLALRLKIAGVSQSLIKTQPNINKALNSLYKQPGSIANILPTYTALLSLRKILTLKKILPPLWQN